MNIVRHKSQTIIIIKKKHQPNPRCIVTDWRRNETWKGKVVIAISDERGKKTQNEFERQCSNASIHPEEE